MTEPTRDEDVRPVDQVAEEYAKIVAYEIAAKPWAELHALESGDSLIFPDVLHVRQKDGSFKQIKVAFQVPRSKQLRESRAEAKLLAANQNIDQTTDAALFEDLYDNCILWRALRSDTPPHEPFAMSVEDLENRFDRDVLKLAWSKLEGYRRVVDPRPAALTKEQCLLVVAAIAKRRAIDPLHAFDGPAQSSCIVFMASLLTRLLTQQPSSQSSENSTPEP